MLKVLYTKVRFFYMQFSIHFSSQAARNALISWLGLNVNGDTKGLYCNCPIPQTLSFTIWPEAPSPIFLNEYDLYQLNHNQS